MTFGAGFDHPQSPYIIQRKFKKIQRKIMSGSVLAFSEIKSMKRLVTGIVLHSWGPDASFDTHVDILGVTQVRCHIHQICHLWHLCHK